MDVLRSRDGTGAWTESAVSSSEEWRALLMEHFALDDGNVRWRDTTPPPAGAGSRVVAR